MFRIGLGEHHKVLCRHRIALSQLDAAEQIDACIAYVRVLCSLSANPFFANFVFCSRAIRGSVASSNGFFRKCAPHALFMRCITSRRPRIVHSIMLSLHGTLECATTMSGGFFFLHMLLTCVSCVFATRMCDN